MRNYITLFLLSLFSTMFSNGPIRFAVVSDTHIQQGDSSVFYFEEIIQDINQSNSIDFVLIAGDMVQNADSISYVIFSKTLKKINVPYYLVPGNHDTLLKMEYTPIYFDLINEGHFYFSQESIHFIGFNTAPSKIGKGEVQAIEIEWLKETLSKIPTDEPILFLTHYPLLAIDVKNDDEIINLLKKHNTKAVLCGHYHRNAFFSFGGILGLVNRATYRTSDKSAGYNLYEISDELTVTEINLQRGQLEWFQCSF